MKSRTTIALIFFLVSFSAQNAMSQMFAPSKDWVATTEYVSTFEAQDSIYVFFSPHIATLVASHTTGDTSTFVWKKYDPEAKDFFIINTLADLTASTITDLTEGGYRVEITSQNDSTEIFTSWIFIDDVTIDSLSVNSQCAFMQMTPKTSPNVWDIEYERFAYYDLSKPMHTVNNKYGKAYFKNVNWESSDDRVEIPENAPLNLVIESPAPLYNSQYSLTVTNSFGRNLSAQSIIIPAIAVKAEQTIKFLEGDTWNEIEEGNGYEALLELNLKSEAINSDSILWSISKKDYSTYNYDYVEFWSERSSFTSSEEVLPDKSYMVPGYYRVKHLVKNSESGCVDSTLTEILVDSSMIKADAIPNVFSPTVEDGSNDVFTFISPEENIRSMQTCRIRIYNRSGNLMHEYDGDPKQWNGWNGRVKNSNRLASQGIYFYIIECVGWDGKKFKRGPYKGTLYLY